MRIRLRKVFTVCSIEDAEVYLGRVLSPSQALGTNFKCPISHYRSIHEKRAEHESLHTESAWSQQVNVRDLQDAETSSLQKWGTRGFASTSKGRYDVNILLI